MAIFNSYVKLPEGTIFGTIQAYCNLLIGPDQATLHAVVHVSGAQMGLANLGWVEGKVNILKPW